MHKSGSSAEPSSESLAAKAGCEPKLSNVARFQKVSFALTSSSLSETARTKGPETRHKRAEGFQRAKLGEWLAGVVGFPAGFVTHCVCNKKFRNTSQRDAVVLHMGGVAVNVSQPDAKACRNRGLG